MEPSLPLSRIITVSMMPIIGVSTGSGGSSPADIKALQDRLDEVESVLTTKANSSQLGYALIDAGTVSNGGRYVFTNPLGQAPTIVECEIKLGDMWGNPSWVYDPQFGSYGAKASILSDGTIVLMTGAKSIKGTSGGTGNPFNNSNATLLTAPCRIHVWKVTNA